MIDFVLGALFVGLVVRGWVKGLVREALDVVTLVLGAIVAFRLAEPVGAVIGGMSGISMEMARLVGGVIAFVGITIGAAALSSLIHHSIRRLPAMTTVNRAAGAALGAVYGLVLVTVALTLVAMLPMPDAVDEGIQESAIAAALTDPAGPVQRGVETLAGDRVLQAVISLRRLVGERFTVGGSGLALPPAEGRTKPDADSAIQVFDALNRERVAAGVPPLAWSDELAAVAAARADDAYRSGDLGAGGPTLETRLSSAGIFAATLGENLALAATAAGAHEAVVGSPPHRVQLLGDGYRRVGIGVVSGPYGLMVVEVFTG